MTLSRRVLPGLFALSWPLLAGCSGEAAAAPVSAPVSAPVRVASVERGEVTRHLRYAGVLGARDEATLSFAVGGRVEAVLVDDGARVRRGQPLARLEARAMTAAVEQATEGLKKAERDLARLRSLHEAGSLPLGELQNAETGAGIARAALRGARAGRDQAGLAAPSDGVIEKRLVERGEVVGPGQPLFRLRVAGAWVVRVGVTDRDVVGLERGMKAAVTLDARPGETLEAEIGEIAQAATPRLGTFEVELRLRSEPPGARVGLSAKVDLPVVVRGAATVPASALLPGVAGPEVLALSEGERVRRRGVQVAFLTGDRAVLAGGCEGVERVVVQGGSALADDERVQVVSAESAR